MKGDEKVKKRQIVVKLGGIQLHHNEKQLNTCEKCGKRTQSTFYVKNRHGTIGTVKYCPICGEWDIIGTDWQQHIKNSVEFIRTIQMLAQKTERG